MADPRVRLAAPRAGRSVDLHTHSSASDGALTPAELVARARAAGVGLLALTDHDTVAGYTALPRTRFGDLEVVPGIEISARWRSAGVHVVGLGIDPHGSAMRAVCEHQAAARAARAATFAARLARRGIPDALAGAAAEAAGRPIGRPHFARFLVRRGAARDEARAFRRFLRDDAATCRPWPELARAIEWIRDAGGIAVLAHPAKYGLTRRRLETLVQVFAEAGGDALEVVCGRQPDSVTRTLAALALGHDLAGSVGSDFHAPARPWAALGAVETLPAPVRPVWAAA